MPESVPSTPRFVVRLTPRGGADRVGPVVDGALAIRVAAPPVDGAANAALVRLLARTLEVPIVRVRLVAGATTRRKVIEVAGVEAALLRARWPGLDV